jgi:serine/threonine protein kinase
MSFDRDLSNRLPLPLAQLYGRAFNGKTHQVRHDGAYYLWEASLKLLACTTIAEYAALRCDDPRNAELLKSLVRPALGHWWALVRTLTPVLAGNGDAAFAHINEQLFTAQNTSPPVLQLFRVLQDEQRRGVSSLRNTVRLSDVFENLIIYRNSVFGHGGLRSEDYYERVAPILLNGVGEILTQVDLLVGRRLLYVSSVQGSARRSVQLYDLAGMQPTRLEPWTVSGAAGSNLPDEQSLCVAPASSTDPRALKSLLPFVTYNEESGEVFFYNARRGGQRTEYLCYTTGQVEERRNIVEDVQQFVARVLGSAAVPGEPDATESRASEPEVATEPVRIEPEPQRRRSSSSDTRASAFGPQPSALDDFTHSSRQPASFVTPAMLAEFERAGFNLLSLVEKRYNTFVYRAVQTGLGRQVALHCLVETSPEPERVRFLRGIRAWGRAEHPNLLKILTTGNAGAQSFYATTWIEGAALQTIAGCLNADGSASMAQLSLDAWRKALRDACEQTTGREVPIDRQQLAATLATSKGPAPAGAIDWSRRDYSRHLVELLRQVCDAVQSLHSAGIIHRNIKPESILVSADGTQAILAGIEVLKEGLDAGGLTHDQAFIGTIRYASPEQIIGDALDGRSDIYILGIVLWEQLARRPFYANAASEMEIFSRIVRQAAEPIRKYNPRVSESLDAVVRKCLEKDRNLRFSTAGELADALHRAVTPRGVAAVVGGLWRSMSGWLSPPPVIEVESKSAAPLASVGVDVDMRPAPRESDTTRPPLSDEPEVKPDVPREPEPVSSSGDQAAVLPKRHLKDREDTPRMMSDRTGMIDEQAFSSRTIETLYPQPIAVAFRRFYQKPDGAAKLLELYDTLETLLRYLVVLALSDLFQSLAETGREHASLPDDKLFDMFRQPKTRGLQLGQWLELVRKLAIALGKESRGRMVEDFPRVCGEGSDFDTKIAGPLIALRNNFVHRNKNSKSTEEVKKYLAEGRALLEQAMREVRFVCRFPLGFVTPALGEADAPDHFRYSLHSAMGAELGNTEDALAVETTTQLQEDVPFVVSPDGKRLMYLWPLLLQRRAEWLGRRALYMYHTMPDNDWPYLTQIQSVGIEWPEEWCVQLNEEPARSHAWLLEKMRSFGRTPSLPADQRIAAKLFPSRSGKLVHEQILDYRLVEVIASGGFGTVYLAVTTEGEQKGEHLAIKVIESHPTKQEKARFTQEISKLKQAGQHPGIIRCFEHGTALLRDREWPWYSMEYAAGGDLRWRLENRRSGLQRQILAARGESPPQEVSRIPWHHEELKTEIRDEFQAVADAVAYLHGMDIVHRDIKPANVLVMEDGSLRLSDFGIVKNLNPGEESIKISPRSEKGAGQGTPGYMSPEQAKGQRVDKTADVYSLGILLAELALGERPKPEAFVTKGSTLANWKDEDKVSWWQKLKDNGLKDLILRCTHIDTADRPADAAKLLEEFKALV